MIKKTVLYFLLCSVLVAPAAWAQTKSTKQNQKPCCEKWYEYLLYDKGYYQTRREIISHFQKTKSSFTRRSVSPQLSARYQEIDRILRRNPALHDFTPYFSAGGQADVLPLFSAHEYALLKQILSTAPQEMDKRPQPTEALYLVNIPIPEYRGEEHYIYIRFQQKRVDFSILFNITENLIYFYKDGYYPLYLPTEPRKILK